LYNTKQSTVMNEGVKDTNEEMGRLTNNEEESVM
jgi:hypothetical protein